MMEFEAEKRQKRNAEVDEMIKNMADPKVAEKLRIYRLVEQQFEEIEAQVQKDVVHELHVKKQPENKGRLTSNDLQEANRLFQRIDRLKRDFQRDLKEETSPFKPKTDPPKRKSKLPVVRPTPVKPKPVKPKPKVTNLPRAPKSAQAKVKDSQRAGNVALSTFVHTDAVPEQIQHRKTVTLTGHLLQGVDIPPSIAKHPVTVIESLQVYREVQHSPVPESRKLSSPDRLVRHSKVTEISPRVEPDPIQNQAVSIPSSLEEQNPSEVYRSGPESLDMKSSEILKADSPNSDESGKKSVENTPRKIERFSWDKLKESLSELDKSISGESQKTDESLRGYSLSFEAEDSGNSQPKSQPVLPPDSLKEIKERETFEGRQLPEEVAQIFSHLSSDSATSSYTDRLSTIPENSREDLVASSQSSTKEPTFHSLVELRSKSADDSTIIDDLQPMKSMSPEKLVTEEVSEPKSSPPEPAQPIVRPQDLSLSEGPLSDVTLSEDKNFEEKDFVEEIRETAAKLDESETTTKESSIDETQGQLSTSTSITKTKSSDISEGQVMDGVLASDGELTLGSLDTDVSAPDKHKLSSVVTEVVSTSDKSEGET